jgi:hypothetical protein
MEETQKQKIMRILNVSADEAETILREDKEIDQGKKKDFDLTPEQEKISKQYTKTHERKKPITFDRKPRERKVNTIKLELITYLNNCLLEFFGTENVTIINKERLISFEHEGEKYELTLVQKRKTK